MGATGDQLHQSFCPRTLSLEKQIHGKLGCNPFGPSEGISEALQGMLWLLEP